MAYDQALALVLQHVPHVGVASQPLASALGCVLREAVNADRDQPPFDRSAMDGFAVHSDEVKSGASWPIMGTVPAGARQASQRPLSLHTVVRIATGAPLPPGADAVVPIERATVDESVDPQRVRFVVDRFEPWRNVHRRASDATQGQVLLSPGVRMTPQRLGVAAAVGAVSLQVAAPLRITLLTTGDEVVAPETPTGDLQPQQIRNSNGIMVRALLAMPGVELLEHVHVPDEPQRVLAAAREALSRSHMVVTVGGVSAGQRDFLPWAWEQLSLRTLVRGVAIQPGKPLFVATPSHADSPDNKLVIGLPGNPVSVLATAHLFLKPAVEHGLGMARIGPMWQPRTLAQPVKPNAQRELFRAAVVEEDGRITALPWQGSGDLVHTAAADGWMRLPMQEDELPAGETVMYVGMQ